MATSTRRGPPLTQEEIVSAALLIADAEGLDAVSMRRVASDLGVGAMTLYHHVADKRELMLLMGDHVSGELLITGEFPSNWREALRAIAHNTRAAHERHPWLLESVRQRPGPTPNTLRHIEQSIAAVANLDIGADAARTMVLATDDYTIGYVMRRIVMEQMRERGTFPGLTPALTDLLASGEFPRLSAIVAEEGDLLPPPEGFDQGLEWLFDGMEAMLERSRR